jgi:hypothetical protein
LAGHETTALTLFGAFYHSFTWSAVSEVQAMIEVLDIAAEQVNFREEAKGCVQLAKAETREAVRTACYGARTAKAPGFTRSPSTPVHKGLVSQSAEPADARPRPARQTGNIAQADHRRGRSASTPKDIPAKGWKDILRRVYNDLSEHQAHRFLSARNSALEGSRSRQGLPEGAEPPVGKRPDSWVVPCW